MLYLIPTPCTMIQKLPPGGNAGRSQLSPCFPSFRDHSPVVLIAQCLETVVSHIWSSFLGVFFFFLIVEGLVWY